MTPRLRPLRDRGGRYVADLTENREIYILHLYSTPRIGDPSEFRKYRLLGKLVK